VRQRSQDLQDLGQAVRLSRQRAGLSQEGLADRAGVHRTYIGGVERGERNASYLMLVKILGGLGVGCRTWRKNWNTPGEPQAGGLGRRSRGNGSPQRLPLTLGSSACAKHRSQSRELRVLLDVALPKPEIRQAVSHREIAYPERGGQRYYVRPSRVLRSNQRGAAGIRTFAANSFASRS
jgi:DNA-binding XRE family transcriptional regulator